MIFYNKLIIHAGGTTWWWGGVTIKEIQQEFSEMTLLWLHALKIDISVSGTIMGFF